MNKYGAHRVELDGYTFDSKKEATHYQELLLRARAGEITDLEVHPRWDLVVNKHHIGRYTADFQYLAKAVPPLNMEMIVVEDVKGVRTRDYILRKKLMLALYGITVQEV